MVEFSAVMFSEGRKDVLLIVLSPASRTVSGTLGNFNEFVE